MKNKKYIITIDTGSHNSSWIVFNKETEQFADKDSLPNLECVRRLKKYFKSGEVEIFIIEQSQGMGQAAGMEIYMNLHFQGLFASLAKQYNIKVRLLMRKEVKMSLCQALRGVNDSSVNLAIREIYGGDDCKNVLKRNLFYYNEEVESNGGRRYMENNLWAAMGLLHVYLTEPNLIQKELIKIDKQYVDYLESELSIEEYLDNF